MSNVMFFVNCFGLVLESCLIRLIVNFLQWYEVCISWIDIVATCEKNKQALTEIKELVVQNTHEIESSNAKIEVNQQKLEENIVSTDQNTNNIKSVMIEISKNEANREDVEIVAQLKDSVAGNLNSNN